MVVKASISDTFILINSIFIYYLLFSCDAWILPLNLIVDYCAMETYAHGKNSGRFQIMRARGVCGWERVCMWEKETEREREGEVLSSSLISKERSLVFFCSEVFHSHVESRATGLFGRTGLHPSSGIQRCVFPRTEWHRTGSLRRKMFSCVWLEPVCRRRSDLVVWDICPSCWC